LDDFIQSAPGLDAFQFVLSEAKKASQFLLSAPEELLLAQMKNTGSSSWSKLQNQIVSTLTGFFEGQEQTITVLRSKAYDASRHVRKEAFEAELLAYKKKETESCACLNAIKGEVIMESKKRGYDSPLHKTLVSSRMDKETLDAMMLAIKEYLPYFRQYLTKKATLLGHEAGLPFYDLFAPIGDVDMRYSYEEACAFITQQFSSFSETLGQFAQNAFDHHWIDVYPREGKVAGAFCANLHSIKESRIMTNFSGSFNDLSTLAHELGHGYHGYCLKDALSLNSEYPMPLAETASIFCETIVFNAALKTATPEEALVILENSLMGSTQVIVDIYSRYLFETTLFENRENASLSVDELKEAMTKAQIEAYGEGLNAETLHPYMWMCKPHYYSAGTSFYNFPYAFGLLFAKGLYALYQKDPGSFVNKYDELLLATGCNSIHDVLKIVGIDSHQPDFFRNSLELIKQEIIQFIS
jgi:pepF/M3 family oligoendopeptidase